ncbi:hypothetical protein Vretifemale_17655 [Volvox reticuliferus]|uniref:Uncharacterized protein n=1 Tax=Volvox reticuliferus TaxID=1737510 RepID=A0A8J4FTQ5_9CHLO|nr:hypothetical protein Vretifemale_17655 [Volvox reticuliferus]
MCTTNAHCDVTIKASLPFPSNVTPLGRPPITRMLVISAKWLAAQEGGVKALVAAVEEGRKKGAGAAGANSDDAGEGGDGKGVIIKSSARGRILAKAATKEQQRQRPQQQKRRAAEDDLDRIARDGLAAMAATRGDAPNPKRRRRGIVEEGAEGGSDRLDRLVAQYRAKLSGERPNKEGAPKPSNPKNAKAHGGKGQVKKSGGRGGGGGGGGGGVAELVAGGAAGGLRRWFDG